MRQCCEDVVFSTLQPRWIFTPWMDSLKYLFTDQGGFMMALLDLVENPSFSLIQPGTGRNPSVGLFPSKPLAEFADINGAPLGVGVADLLIEADADLHEQDRFGKLIVLDELLPKVPGVPPQTPHAPCTLFRLA
jgi:hypothetical protein